MSIVTFCLYAILAVPACDQGSSLDFVVCRPILSPHDDDHGGEGHLIPQEFIGRAENARLVRAASICCPLVCQAN